MALQTQQLTGTIVWYSKKQGFGFVSPDSEGDDIFVHHSALPDNNNIELNAGDRIRFSLEQRKKGPSAVDVLLLNGGLGLAATNGGSKSNETTSKIVSNEDDSFASLELHGSLLRAVKEAGYTEPTSIQSQAIPWVLEGRDVMGCAQTGTGKTAAFALPMLQRLYDSQPANKHTRKLRKQPKRDIRTLVLSPTRELAIQIGDSFSTYGRYTGLKNTVIFGGVNQNPQVKAIRNGVDVLVATPGRLLDLIGQGHIKLDKVSALILDEADRMLDMGFIHDVKRILKHVPQKRQTLLFSATMSREVIDLSETMLQDPIHVSVAPEQPTVEAIQQAVYFVSTKKKQSLLEHLLIDPNVERTLVFTRTKHGANRVVKNLGRAGIESEAIHGNKSQAARQKALKRFRDGKIQVLVATDVVSRGIDIDDISHVIQFDLPHEPEVYVHRIGRTGRAGAGGTAISFCSDGERSDLKAIEKLIKMKVPVVRNHIAE